MGAKLNMLSLMNQHGGDRSRGSLTWQLRIEGQVQGVGYRHGLRREALRLNLTGWVRNRSDGSVEAVARGPRDRLEALAYWARRGPPTARVSRVTVNESRAGSNPPFYGFEQLPNA